MRDTFRLEVSDLLHAWRRGDRTALDKLMPRVYDELKRLAHHYIARERTDHTLQTTALVNEAYLRLVDLRSIEWQDRAHFFAIAAGFMRRILVDYARARRYRKRRGNTKKVSLNEEAFGVPAEVGSDFVGLDEALETLSEWDARKARVVEMRFFGGMTEEEVAEVLGISLQTVKRDWRLAKAWLRHFLTAGDKQK